MTKLALKFVLLIAPFVALSAIELFVLPIYFFTFRNWEALLAVNVRPAEGPFYPDMEVKRRDEHGDRLGFSDNRPKTVEWITDHDGYRNRPRADSAGRYDIVLVGDSLIVGSYLDQKDGLAEVLERKCGCAVFSYAAMPKIGFFFDPKFQQRPPKAVVVEIRTGERYNESALRWNFNASIDDLSGWTFSGSPPPASALPRWLAILSDRFLKANMLQYVRSRLRVALRDPILPEREISIAQRNDFVFEAVSAMDGESRRRGMQFALLVIPDGPPADRTLDQTIVRLKEAGVKVIAYLPNDERSDWANIDHFFSDRDSHWREETVVATADKVLQALGLTVPPSVRARADEVIE
jgi:hypothetical protein